MCPNIVELDLSSNRISDASVLAGLEHLEKLRLTDNAIESLSFASELPSLTQLLVQGNRVGHMREIGHLAGIKGLRTLYLRNIDGGSPNPRALPSTRGRGLAPLPSEPLSRYTHALPRCADCRRASHRAVCEHLAYRSSIFRQLEALTNLDGQRCVGDEEAEALQCAPCAAAALTDPILVRARLAPVAPSHVSQILPGVASQSAC